MKPNVVIRISYFIILFHFLRKKSCVKDGHHHHHHHPLIGMFLEHIHSLAIIIIIIIVEFIFQNKTFHD